LIGADFNGAAAGLQGRKKAVTPIRRMTGYGTSHRRRGSSEHCLPACAQHIQTPEIVERVGTCGGENARLDGYAKRFDGRSFGTASDLIMFRRLDGRCPSAGYSGEC
jgi:hypothetical protein